tara:strand:+ start:73913 stop:74119 length:207 start_codon:yes stop_codon:yes gene_type:complete
MSKYELKYAYGAQGSDWEEYGPTIIEAEDKDEALFKFHKQNGMKFTTLESFRKKEDYIKNWATTCKKL